MFSGNKGFFLQIAAVIILLVVVLIGVLQLNKDIYGGDVDFKFDLSTLLGQGTVQTGFTKEPAFTLKYTEDYQAEIVTTHGTLIVDLLERSAPYTVNNFVFLANKEYYEGTSFHRLVPGFILQGGDRNTLNDNPNDDGFGDPGYQIKDEINWDALQFSEAKKQELQAEGYTSDTVVPSQHLGLHKIAMANEGIPNTNGSQFFIVIGNSPEIEDLDGRHTVFGQIIDGFDALDRMTSSEVDNTDPNSPRPKTPIIITKITIKII